MVELLVRLHLAGIFWGDCSLSNTLFRPDAGSVSAYLVDAETVERHADLSAGQRDYDVELATERVAAELMDLEIGGLLPERHRPDRDRHDAAAAVRGAVGRGDPRGGLPARGAALPDRRARCERLNELGFDVDEVELIDHRGRRRELRVQTRVAEPGQHRREFFRLTGLEVEENQARRLLNDLRSFRAWLEQRERPAGARDGGRAPVGQRGLRAGHGRDPGRPRGRLAPPEIFHEILEHRWFLSEQAGRDVGTTAAARSYFETVLPQTPKEVDDPLGDGGGLL